MSNTPGTTSDASSGSRRFVQSSYDSLGLGPTPAQRSAEVIAGLRATIVQDNETKALASIRGKIVAQMFVSLTNKQIVRYVPARMWCVTQAARHIIAGKGDHFTLVEVAVGFSPRTLHLAREYPNAEIIEIDLPHVIEERQNRLRKGHVDVPDNVKQMKADLGSTPLADVLGETRADIITAEGLTQYFEPEENVLLFRNLRQALKPDGAFVTEIYYKSKMQRMLHDKSTGAAGSLFMRQVGNAPGLVKDDDELRQWLDDAGYGKTQQYSAEELLAPLGEDKPLLDIQTYIIAWNKADNTEHQMKQQAGNQTDSQDDTRQQSHNTSDTSEDKPNDAS